MVKARGFLTFNISASQNRNGERMEILKRVFATWTSHNVVRCWVSFLFPVIGIVWYWEDRILFFILIII